MINIVSSSRYPVARKNLTKKVEELLQKHSLPLHKTLNIVFVGRIKMKQIANTYKHENVALPVLAFPYHEQDGEQLIGEIIICYPQAVLLAAERNKTVEDMLMWLLDHGIKNLLKN